MWQELLITIITIVVSIVLNQVRLLITAQLQQYAKTDKEKQLLDYLSQGMAEVQNTMVRELKAKSEDGRLTLEEIKEVEKAAFSKAINLSSDPTIQQEFSSWTNAKISSEIKQLLAKWAKNE